MIKAVTKDGVVSGDGATLCGDTCAIVSEPEPEDAKQERGGDGVGRFLADAVIAAIMMSES